MDYSKYKNKKFVLEQISNVIKSEPQLVAKAIESSGIHINDSNDRIELVNKTAYGLSHNAKFPSKIGQLLAFKEKEKFSNLGGRGKVDVKEQLIQGGSAIGKGTVSGAQSGGIWGAIAGFVVGSVDAGFGAASAKNKAKIEEEQYRQELLGKLFGGNKKNKNLVPILIIGGVLVVGAIVTFIVLKE